jgi:hypothetical protein
MVWFFVAKNLPDSQYQTSFISLEGGKTDYRCDHPTNTSPPTCQTIVGNSSGNNANAKVSDSKLSNDYVSAHTMEHNRDSGTAETRVLTADGTTLTATDSGSNGGASTNVVNIGIPTIRDNQPPEFHFGMTYRDLLTNSSIDSILSHLHDKYL